MNKTEHKGIVSIQLLDTNKTKAEPDYKPGFDPTLNNVQTAARQSTRSDSGDPDSCVLDVVDLRECFSSKLFHNDQQCGQDVCATDTCGLCVVRRPPLFENS